METDDFFNLDVKQVVEWVSSDDVTVSAEEEVSKGIVKWVNHNKSERESDFPDLFHQVRLVSISHDFLFSTLVNEGLIKSNIECVNFVLEFMESSFSATSEIGTKPPRKCLEMLMAGIFVCGGRQALCYLRHQNKWYQLVDMTLEHQNHAAVQYRGRVFIFSEPSLLGQSLLVEYYVPSTNSLGTIRINFEYDAQFSSLLVLTGYTTLFVLTNTGYWNAIFTYHPDKNKWEMFRDEALSRWGACGVTDGHHLYIIAGTHKVDKVINATATVEKIDPSGDSWQEVAAMNEARQCFWSSHEWQDLHSRWDAKEWADLYRA